MGRDRIAPELGHHPLVPGRFCAADAVLLGLVFAFAAFLWAAGATLDPTARDQVHDLSLAIRIREGSALTDGNRHPLLPALLAPVARREPGFFTDARAISVVLTALVLLLYSRAVRKSYGKGLALFAAVLWLFELRFQARRICPEPLVAGLIVVAVSILSRAATSPRRLLAVFAAGAWTGAAWLAKGSAILMLPAFGLHLLTSRGRRGILEAAVLVLGFAGASLPLLLHNAREHGSPTWNANSAHVMWEDAWDQELDVTSTATPASYFASHGAGDALARLSDGLVRQKGVEWVYAFLAVALVGRFLLRGPGPIRDASDGASSPAREWMRIAVWTSLVWLPAFAWYAPIVSSRRLLFPIFGVLLPPALDVASRLLPAAAPRLRVPAVLPWTLAGILAACAIAFVVRAGNPWEKGPIDAPSMEAVDAIAARTRRGDRVLVRPSRTFPPDWLLEGRVRFVGLPAKVSDADAPAWIRANCDAVLLNEGLLRSRRGAFSGAAGWNDETGVTISEGAARSANLVRDAGRRVVYAVVPAATLFFR